MRFHRKPLVNRVILVNLHDCEAPHPAVMFHRITLRNSWLVLKVKGERKKGKCGMEH